MNLRSSGTLTTDADGAGIVALLNGYSVEITAGDRRTINAAGELLRAGTEVFIASLPKDRGDEQVLAASTLARLGLTPVPHIVARNIADFAALDALLGRLVTQAGVQRALLLAGDRDKPAGALHSSLQLIESGILQKHGLRRIFLSAYPEGHPRIDAAELARARAAKLVAARQSGLDVELVSQFCFEAEPILAFAQQLRGEGISIPLRVGVAGCADRTTLLKYGLRCGIGPSLRALRDHHELVRNALVGGTPDVLLAAIARARTAEPALNIAGIHFFPFGALGTTVRWAELYRSGGPRSAGCVASGEHH